MDRNQSRSKNSDSVHDLLRRDQKIGMGGGCNEGQPSRCTVNNFSFRQLVERRIDLLATHDAGTLLICLHTHAHARMLRKIYSNNNNNNNEL